MTPPTEERIRDRYEAYLSAFHTHTASEVLSYFNLPVTVVTQGEVRVLSSVEDLEVMYADILKALAESDYSHTVMASREVTVLDDKMALMRVVGTRYDRRGRALERIAAVYTFIRRDDSWQIAVMMPFTPAE
jgi:Domain of unknown function (DUF4440)